MPGVCPASPLPLVPILRRASQAGPDYLQTRERRWNLPRVTWPGNQGSLLIEPQRRGGGVAVPGFGSGPWYLELHDLELDTYLFGSHVSHL